MSTFTVKLTESKPVVSSSGITVSLTDPNNPSGARVCAFQNGRIPFDPKYFVMEEGLTNLISNDGENWQRIYKMNGYFPSFYYSCISEYVNGSIYSFGNGTSMLRGNVMNFWRTSYSLQNCFPFAQSEDGITAFTSWYNVGDAYLYFYLRNGDLVRVLSVLDSVSEDDLFYHVRYIVYHPTLKKFIAFPSTENSWNYHVVAHIDPEFTENNWDKTYYYSDDWHDTNFSANGIYDTAAPIVMSNGEILYIDETGVKVSSDYGKNFTLVNSELTSDDLDNTTYRTKCLVEVNGVVVFGNDFGIQYSKDFGRSWAFSNITHDNPVFQKYDGFTYIFINSISVDPNTGYLYAAIMSDYYEGDNSYLESGVALWQSSNGISWDMIVEPAYWWDSGDAGNNDYLNFIPLNSIAIRDDDYTYAENVYPSKMYNNFQELLAVDVYGRRIS